MKAPKEISTKEYLKLSKKEKNKYNQIMTEYYNNKKPPMPSMEKLMALGIKDTPKNREHHQNGNIFMMVENG